MTGVYQRQRVEVGVTPTQQVREIYKCYQDVVYFVNRYVRIYDSLLRKWIVFELWKEQAEVLRLVDTENRIVILKARQLGLTWVLLAFLLHGMLFRPVYNALIFSRRDTESIHLLDERLKGMHRRLPGWLIQGIEIEIGGDNKHTLILSNGSVARAFAPTAGDTYTANIVLVDEADLVPNLGGLLRAVRPTVDNGGKLVLLSRSNKDRPLSTFKRIYMGAKAGKNSYAPVFLPWQVHPLRDARWYAEQVRDALDTDNSLDVVHEQYPNTDIEALRAATKGKRFGHKNLEACYKEEDPLTNDLVTDIAEMFPEIRLYRLPETNHEYVIGCDPAEGVIGGNHSSVTVMDAATSEEVAVLEGIYDIDMTGTAVIFLSKLYNDATALVERNNHGHAVLVWVRVHSSVKLLPGNDGRLGWSTTAKSKVQMCSNFSEALRYKEVTLHDIISFSQLASIDAKTLEAPEGMLDDTATSVQLAYLATGMAYTVQEDDHLYKVANLGY